jgi:hypothetical protein
MFLLKRWVRSLVLGGSCALFLMGAPPALAQGDGARVYQAVPDGAQVLTAWGIFNDGNQSADPGSIVRGSSLDLNLGVVQYNKALSVDGRGVGVFAVLPFGSVEGTVALPQQSVTGHSSGIGDILLGGIWGLIGTDALSAEEYARFRPGFALAALGKLSLPTGTYDASKVINLGANRYSMQLGLPMVQYWGESFFDPALTGFELLPAVTFFGENDSPFGADTSKQAPIYKLEAHLTRNLNRAVWVSADALYTNGGETTTDGDKGNDRKRSFMLGATISSALSRSLSVRATYGEVVSRNDNGLDGKMLRVAAVFVF